MRIKSIIISAVALIVGATACLAQTHYALVNVSTAYVRSKPSHSAELVTQQLMGFPVKILSSKGEWSEIETIDGYRGYIINNTLQAFSAKQYAEWKQSQRGIVTTNREQIIVDDEANMVSDNVPGAILVYEISDSLANIAKVTLPDGRFGYLPGEMITDINEWANQPYDAARIIEYGCDNLGVPYLWGGMSTKGMDCSGLTWTAYWLNGRLLQRDSSKQALMGDKIADWRKLQPGDLAFFGNPATGRVTHVALVRDEKGGIVHASQGRVRYNSLDPSAPDHITAAFLHGISLRGLTPIDNSPRISWLTEK